jgi:hypothetical protein
MAIDSERVAVLTGDVVHSSKVARIDPEAVPSALRTAFGALEDPERPILASFQISRGDSFQGVLQKPHQAFRAALLLRLMLRKGQYPFPLDVRIGIGVGPVDRLVPDHTGEGSGPAFTFSGATLDNLKRTHRDERTRIGCGDPALEDRYNTVLGLVDVIAGRWSAYQASAALGALGGAGVSETAAAESVSKQAISRRLRTAAFWSVEQALQYLERDAAAAFAELRMESEG